jgi:hypothetical protein
VTGSRNTSSRGAPRERGGGPSVRSGSLAEEAGVALLDEDSSQAERDRLLAYEEWRLACRVAESARLRKSELLPRFLLYVCEQYLLGREAEISEQRIGIQVFNRPENYNPGEDNIVRSYARLLRKRLDAYFENEGADEATRILIPRGGYVPVFEPRSRREDAVASSLLLVDRADEPTSEAPERLAEAKRIEQPVSATAMRPLWKTAWLLIAVGLLGGSLLTSGLWLAWDAVQAASARGPAHPLWDRMFQHDRNTLIVVTDSGLGITQNATRTVASVEDYANGSYLSGLQAPSGLDAANFNDLRRQRYTSVVSVNIVSALERLPEFIVDRTQIRFAREIGPEDLRSSNLVLIGSKHTDPWVSLFEKKLNFKLEYTPQVDDSFIVNQRPQPTEQKIYRNSADSGAKTTYGAIAFVPSLDGAGHALIVEGLNMAATQAAADVLFKPSIIGPVIRQARSQGGDLRPFELLVETVSVGATAPEVKVIAMRISQQ